MPTNFTRTTSDTVPVAESVARVVHNSRAVTASVLVSESVHSVGPTIFFAVPVGGVNAAVGLLPTESLGAAFALHLTDVPLVRVLAPVPGLSIGSSSFVFDVDLAEVAVHGLLPTLVLTTPGDPGAVGDFFGLPIVLSGLSGSGTLSLQPCTLEAGEAGAMVPAQFSAVGARSLWLRYTAPVEGAFTFTINDSSSTDYRLAIFQGSGVDDPTLTLDISVTADGATDPTVTIGCAAGQTYYIYVGSITDAGAPYPPMPYAWSYTASVLVPVLDIDPDVLDRVPTGLVIGLVNMLVGGELVDFSVVGNAAILATWAADESGTIVGVTVPLGLPLVAGTYTLQAQGQTSSRIGTHPFQLLQDPLTRPAPPPDDLPVSPPTQVGIQRWVFQDPMPGGLGTLVFPANPEKMSSPFSPAPITVEHTVAQDGTAVIWEGAAVAHPMQFSGYVDDPTFYADVQAFFELNRKFYWIDHRGRVWTVTMLEFGPDRRILQPTQTAPRDWAANYTAQLMIFAGPM